MYWWNGQFGLGQCPSLESVLLLVLILISFMAKSNLCESFVHSIKVPSLENKLVYFYTINWVGRNFVWPNRFDIVESNIINVDNYITKSMFGQCCQI